jgi:hypothetical protein
LCSLVFCKLPQKYVTLLLLVLANLLFSYDFVNCVAVLLVGHSLFCLQDSQRLESCTRTLDEKVSAKVFKCLGFAAYIDAKTASVNKYASTDHLVPFDRRSIRGRVSSDSRFKEQLDSDKPLSVRSTSAQSTSTTATRSSTLSAEMAQIGGSRSRQQSKLLDRKPPAKKDADPAPNDEEKKEDDL